MDSKLSFHEHMVFVLKRANRTWNFIVRQTRSFHNWESIRHLYVTLIKSVIMYGSSIWRPQFNCHILMFERLQHRVLRLMAWKSGFPINKFLHNYSLEASKFNLASVYSSMLANDVIFMFKIISGNIECKDLSDLIPWRNCNAVTRNKDMFYTVTSFNAYYDREPIFRLCKLYDSFSQTVPILRNFNAETNCIAHYVREAILRFE